METWLNILTIDLVYMSSNHGSIMGNCDVILMKEVTSQWLLIPLVILLMGVCYHFKKYFCFGIIILVINNWDIDMNHSYISNTVSNKI